MSTLADGSNCSFVPDRIKSESDIAGIGVILSLIITAATSILFSYIIFGLEWMKFHETIIIFLRKILNSFCTQQIATGITAQVLAIWQISKLTYYHFFTLWKLSLLSSVTYVITLLVLANKINSDLWRWLQRFLVFANFSLSFSLGIIILKVQRKEYIMPTLSIMCLLKLPSGPLSTGTRASFIITVIVIAFLTMMFVFSTCLLRIKFEEHSLALIKSIGLVILNIVWSMAVFWIIKQSDAFNKPPHDIMSNRDEEIWNFGQMFAMLLLILPIMSVIGQYCENKFCPDDNLLVEEGPAPNGLEDPKIGDVVLAEMGERVLNTVERSSPDKSCTGL